MAAATAAIIGAVALSAAATAYQASEARKARKAAEANAQTQLDEANALQEQLKAKQATEKDLQSKAFAEKPVAPPAKPRSTGQLKTSTILTSPLGTQGPAQTIGKKLIGE